MCLMLVKKMNFKNSRNKEELRISPGCLEGSLTCLIKLCEMHLEY